MSLFDLTDASGCNGNQVVKFQMLLKSGSGSTVASYHTTHIIQRSYSAGIKYTPGSARELPKNAIFTSWSLFI